MIFFPVLKCPTLDPPKNGYFVNDKCKSVFNAACGLRCKPGYDLQGSGLRICREDGTWSGTDTSCISKYIMKICPSNIIVTEKNEYSFKIKLKFFNIFRIVTQNIYVGTRHHRLAKEV